MSGELVLDEVINQLGQALGPSSSLGGTLIFDFGVFGSALLDGKSSPNEVSNGVGKTADCTIKVDIATFEKMANGSLDGMMAYMQGKLQVAGDMGLAMKVGPILAKARK